MADLTDNQSSVLADVHHHVLLPDVILKSAVQMYEKGALFRDPGSSYQLVTAPAGSPLLMAHGVASTNQLGDGLRAAVCQSGLFERENSASTDAIPAYLPLGWPLYAPDNQAASLTNGGGTRPLLGHFGGFSKAGKPLVWIGFCPYPLTELMIPIAKGHADIADAAATQAFSLLTLPGPARVMHPPTVDSLATAFSGGGTGSGTLAIGADADPDALGDEKSIFTGGAAGAMTAGVLGYPGALLIAGTVITATFVADTTVGAFTAGAVVATLRLRPGN